MILPRTAQMNDMSFSNAICLSIRWRSGDSPEQVLHWLFFSFYFFIFFFSSCFSLVNGDQSFINTWHIKTTFHRKKTCTCFHHFLFLTTVKYLTGTNFRTFVLIRLLGKVGEYIWNTPPPQHPLNTRNCSELLLISSIYTYCSPWELEHTWHWADVP